ncbi:MAG: DUF2203 family protein [Planctomycetota bacterium]|nr:MAG: DUF2203 family protein [Planctomycetota bacterium]
MPKVFTPLEANRTLPLVRRIVADVLVRGRELRRLQALEDLTVEDEDRAAVLVAELQELLDELEQVGCSFRCPNFEFGIVDFPGIIDGRPVHLCWRDDEPELRYYHDPRAGFAGRLPIPQELLTAQA